MSIKPGSADESFAAYDAAVEFARVCRAVEEHTPPTSPTSLMDSISMLMTELWDNGFSKQEIADAFTGATGDMNPYTGGEARNGTGIRGVAFQQRKA
jgi:hypothetical protein